VRAFRRSTAWKLVFGELGGGEPPGDSLAADLAVRARSFLALSKRRHGDTDGIVAKGSPPSAPAPESPS
jgi:hypothetical protein